MKPTTEDVLKWAREAGFYPENAPAMNPILEKLAALAYAAGAAAERKKCIADCDSVDLIGAEDCITAITERARGEKYD